MSEAMVSRSLMRGSVNSTAWGNSASAVATTSDAGVSMPR